MAIIINNTQQVKEYTQELASNAERISSVKDSIDYILNELAEYWEQTQEDAQSFSEGLRSESNTLGTIVECNKEFAMAMENYITATEATSQTSVGGSAV